MSVFIDGLALPFEFFAGLADPICMSSSTISFVNPQKSYLVILTGRVASEVPEKARSQCFDEHYLLPITKELGLNLTKTAKLIALRNAWIAYFQESEISQISVNEIRLLMTNEIATDYVVLTSAKWPEHPWIREQINQPETEENPASLVETSTVVLDDPMCAMQHQAWIETQLDDINFCINLFCSQKGAYTSLLDIDVDRAEHDIKRAKKRIRELHAEVEKQETIIRDAMKPIRKFQKYERALKKRAPGRPKISELKEQQWQRDIAKKFVSQWISSLMAALLITSCGELAKIVGSQKMTWWRWQNKKTLPPSSYLESLLDFEIKSGEHKSTKLSDIQTTPTLIDLIALVDLV
jgi:hypothetical protein